MKFRSEAARTAHLEGWLRMIGYGAAKFSSRDVSSESRISSSSPSSSFWKEMPKQTAARIRWRECRIVRLSQGDESP